MKNKFNKHFWIISLVITAFTALIIGYSPIDASSTQQVKKAPVAVTKTTTKTTPAATTAVKPTISASSLEIVANPEAYLNKDVKFNATFDKFSTLGLDYKPAMKSAQDYIGILIKRDDVKDHTVPLSEMKLFLKRAEAEKFIDLESGDKIEITGKVFSNALGDPWIEINKFTVLSQANKKEAKK